MRAARLSIGKIKEILRLSAAGYRWLAEAALGGPQRRGKGKRGGLRVIYYFLAADRQVWLFTIYDKDEAVDLTSQEKRALKRAIQSELAARRKKR